jgi:hypothetical protein
MTITVTATHRAPRVSSLTARTPRGLGWEAIGIVRAMGGPPLHAWLHAPTSTQVISSIVMAEQPRSGTVGPQWHVSIVDRSSPAPARPSGAQVALARCAFDLLVAEEDNHHPGAARHLWLPVDPTERVDCECKATEVQVVEADGYRWSNDPVECRGCELERSMRATGATRPCPIHARTAGDVAAPAAHSLGEQR